MNSLLNSPIFLHLLQSTVFAALCALLAAAMRRNSARVRFGLWLAASLKFLIPFSLFTAIGSYFDFLRPAVPAAIEKTPQLFMNFGLTKEGTHAFEARAVPAPDHWQPPILTIVWALGFAFVMFRWMREWLRVRRIARSARAMNLDLAIPVRVTEAAIEPGVFGIWRPVLLLPACMLERWTQAEFAGVIAHEMTHVRRRDNLTAFLHALVEAIFWFHPLVWWIGSRLVEERERACDEAVLRLGNAPESYAEGILKVCEYCVEPGAACAAGVTGADLKLRIREIVANRIAERLSGGKKAMLAGCAILAVSAPLLVGVLHAQSPSKMAFEVASVKANTSADRRGGLGLQVLPGGRISVKNTPLFYIIAWAYDVPFQGAGSRLKGVEALSSLGAEGARFDIEATAEKSAIANDKTQIERTEKVRAMMRTLLAERFHLVIRAETKDVPVYAAIVGKNGSKLEKSTLTDKDCDDDRAPCHNFNGGMGRGLHAQGATMDDLVKFVANWSDRPIVDRTGLKGLYKIETPGWAPVDAPRGDGSQKGEDGVPWSERPTLFTIFEGMGLKLEATHAPIETFTIVSVQKPVEN